MATQTSTKKDRYSIHWIVMFIIAFGFRFLPCPGTVTPYGMAVLGIFVSLIYGWTFLGLLGPSLFGAVIMGTTSYGPVQNVFIAMFSNSTVLMMLIGILAFSAIEQSGAGDWMVAKLLNSKLAKKSPVFILEIFLVIFFLGNICGIVWFLYFALMPLISDMLLKCGYQKGDKFNYFFLAGCLMYGQMGMSFFPFFSWSLMTTGTMMQISQTMISYNEFMAVMAVLDILILVTYPLLMKICGCSFEKLGNVNMEEAFPNVKADAKLTKRQSLALWSVVIFVIAVVLASMLGTYVKVLGWLNTQMGVLGLMTILWVFVIVYKVEGKPVLDMRTAAGGFSWDMLMLFAVAMFISTALTAEETGISTWIAGILGSVFAQTSPLVFLVVLAIVTAVLTNVSNNVALCFVMINIVCSMYLNGFTVNITAAAIIISITSVYVAFLTPAASLPGALLHGDKSLTAATIYKWTWPLLIYALILLLVVTIPYTLISG